ncbi:heparinase II/III family protein [Paeniroseomonas aquatica]|uniref:heparinase II/III domain-containing protein n=1 Tax=Paeniroseomonas aquatica TaxID=373043 RepID=UPI00361ED2E4
MEYPARWFRIADAACRLGPRPVLLAAWHRGPVARRRALRALADAPSPRTLVAVAGPATAARPAGRAPGRGARPGGRAGRGRAGLARSLPRRPACPLARPLRRGRHPPGLGAQPLGRAAAAGPGRPAGAGRRLVASRRRLPGGLGGGQSGLPRAHWACAQEAALRALHLALALALLGAAPPPGARGLLALHGRRIAATPAYALAQDNNHAISEPAGLLACGLLLRDAGWVATGEARLAAARRRLIAADGGFAQLSTGYHRLLLDVLALAEWLRRRHGLPATGEAAAVRWLHRLVDPATGAMPRLGHQDGSAFADLALAGPADARPSLERAARLLAGAGTTPDPGCAWLGLAAAPALPPPEPAWVAGGLRGWQAGGARGVLRIGPLRFRPGHADLLHFDLWDGPRNLLRDGGTGAYNPWHVALAGTAGHNTVEFDGRGQMPAVSRFLFARWPRAGRCPTAAGSATTAATGTSAGSRPRAGSGGSRIASPAPGSARRCAGGSPRGPGG